MVRSETVTKSCNLKMKSCENTVLRSTFGYMEKTGSSSTVKFSHVNYVNRDWGNETASTAEADLETEEDDIDLLSVECGNSGLRLEKQIKDKMEQKNYQKCIEMPSVKDLPILENLKISSEQFKDFTPVGAKKRLQAVIEQVYLSQKYADAYDDDVYSLDDLSFGGWTGFHSEIKREVDDCMKYKDADVTFCETVEEISVKLPILKLPTIIKVEDEDDDKSIGSRGKCKKKGSKTNTSMDIVPFDAENPNDTTLEVQCIMKTETEQVDTVVEETGNKCADSRLSKILHKTFKSDCESTLFQSPYTLSTAPVVSANEIINNQCQWRFISSVHFAGEVPMPIYPLSQKTKMRSKSKCIKLNSYKLGPMPYCEQILPILPEINSIKTAKDKTYKTKRSKKDCAWVGIIGRKIFSPE